MPVVIYQTEYPDRYICSVINDTAERTYWTGGNYDIPVQRVEIVLYRQNNFGMAHFLSGTPKIGVHCPNLNCAGIESATAKTFERAMQRAIAAAKRHVCQPRPYDSGPEPLERW